MRQNLLTVQTDRLSEEDENDLLERTLYIRRHENEPNGKSPYFTEETYFDPEEDPLECFMAYENVWWRRRPWGPPEKQRRRRSGDLF
jgi:hypothetical protein